LILLAPIASSETIAADYLRTQNFNLIAPPSFHLIQNAAELRKYHNPLLIVHGTADNVVPFTQGRRDFAFAGSRDKKFVAVKGNGHGGTIWSIEADDAIAAFMQRHGAIGKSRN
jgi:pimeloyl-ACP methyl ester carboxylesterase